MMCGWLAGIGLALIMACSAGAQTTRSVTLAWDQNPEPDIAGYRLHYGEATGVYTQTIDAGNALTATVNDLIIGSTYFFVVTAYNTAALESLPSDEVSFTADRPKPRKFRGSYSGSIINGADGLNANLKLTLSKNGRFTGRVVLGTAVHRVRGRFDENGRATVVIRASDGSLITLALALDSSSGAILMTIGDPAAGEVTVTLFAKAYSRENPAVQQGRYTLLLGKVEPVAGSEPVVPNDSGFATVVISKTGKVRATGRLADGEVFTINTLLGSDGAFSIYSLLYGKARGLLAGRVAIRDTAGVSDGDGSVAWVKPSGSTPKFYPAGFSGNMPVQVSRFEKFALEQAGVDPSLPPAARLVGGELPAANDPIVKELAFPQRNVIAVLNPSAERLRVTVSPGSGLVRGSFIHPADGQERRIFGVLFQKRRSGGGFFPGVTTTGSFGLENLPHP